MPMTESSLTKYVKTQLGVSWVDVEVESKDMKVIIQKALDKIAPYYDGKRYVLGNGKVVDLSLHDPVAITRVFETKSSSLISLEDYAFGGQNIILYTSDFRDRYISYTAYKMLYNQYQDLKGADYKYIKPYLYLDGYNQDTLIEMIVRPKVLSDIEDTSMFYTWVQEYCLALVKEMVGRIRSKFSVEGSPYALDGANLLSEASQEKSNLEAQLIGDIFIV